ncbi:aconitate hydratase [Burkholderia cenocepacia]|uniref:aconitate hydratase n=1 Tax=Burkholderia cenocepacia TaxID=95486 RepID=UPI001BA17DE0|nr:aconitate hydratase [Burkholderia cenocepacia]MBR8094894.1 aconitate hydratase [Burkholderia cenocepacia]
MARNLATKLIAARLSEGDPLPGSEIAIKIDQVLLQDVLGVLVMLELEALGIDRVKVDLAVQYVDHNLVEADNLNAEEHLFLLSACRRFGLWYSRPGNGISHPVHMQRFGTPGLSLVGSDSHTPAAGAVGMLAFGAGGMEVALALGGEPLRLRMPRIWGVRLTGRLPDWVSAKDVILEMLRRHGLEGGSGRIIEYHGPGLEQLSPMDRHVIANMGAELGATTTVFPSDDQTLRFLTEAGRASQWRPLAADPGASYDLETEIDLSSLEPLIALPSSPGNVVPVREVAGAPIHQAYIGSSANPGYRDFAVAAAIVAGRRVAPHVSLDINPSSRQVLERLVASGRLGELIRAGARIHQAGCNGCIGMGQAPAVGRNSLRTVPRNFPGRSGTREDSVFLCSPETAATSALAGSITDPRTLELPCPDVMTDGFLQVEEAVLVAPLPEAEASLVVLERTALIASLPEFDALPDELSLPVLLRLGNDITTDDIIPAGTRVMPFWSSVQKTAEFAFEAIDPSYASRAVVESSGHAIVAGLNYGQGSSRENAASSPRYLGLRVVVARSFARIHHGNLVNFGILPLTFAEEGEFRDVKPGIMLRFAGLHAALRSRDRTIMADFGGRAIRLQHSLSPRETETVIAGGIINLLRESRARPAGINRLPGAAMTVKEVS